MCGDIINLDEHKELFVVGLVDTSHHSTRIYWSSHTNASINTLMEVAPRSGVVARAKPQGTPAPSLPSPSSNRLVLATEYPPPMVHQCHDHHHDHCATTQDYQENPTVTEGVADSKPHVSWDPVQVTYQGRPATRYDPNQRGGLRAPNSLKDTTQKLAEDSRPDYMAKAICYNCYELGHYKRSCPIRISDYAKIIDNYDTLTEEQKNLVSPQDYQISLAIQKNYQRASQN